MSDEIKGLLLQTNKLIEQNRKAYDEALEKNEQNSAELNTNSKCILRGGAWDSNDISLSTQEYRESNFMGNNIGFRCVQSIVDKTESE